jgi:hypothetical protein
LGWARAVLFVLYFYWQGETRLFSPNEKQKFWSYITMKNIKNNKKLEAIFILLGMIGIFTVNAFAQAPANDNFADAEWIGGMRFRLTRTNVDATKQIGEPNNAFNVGGKSVWFRWTAPMSRVMNITTARSQTTLDSLLAVYRGTDFNDLVPLAYSDNIDDTNQQSNLIFSAERGTTYYIAVDGTNVSGQVSQGDFTLDIKPALTMRGADYDRDGITDISVFRPSIGTWIHLKNWTQQAIYRPWGTTGDIPVVMIGINDTHDRAVYRPSEGKWYRQYSNSSTIYSLVTWGLSNDIPVPEMYSGNKTTDFAVFRPSNGTWYIRDGLDNRTYYRFGLQNDIPVPGQYSPDNFADIAVFRPSNGTWYFTIRIDENTASDTFKTVKFGQTGDKPVPGDYDGDGLLDIAVYRPTTGTWWILQSSNGKVSARQFGIAEDTPVTGDYDGDGKFDLAIFRPSNNTWYIHMSESNSVYIKEFGLAGDIPVTANRNF